MSLLRLFGLSLLLSIAFGLHAEDPIKPSEPSAFVGPMMIPPPEPIPDYLISPQATVQTFLESRVKLKQDPNDQIALQKAIKTFDLSGINILVQKEKARDTVWLLSRILDLSEDIKLKAIPKKPKEDSYRLIKHEAGDIYLLKYTDGRWLFSADSLQRLEALLAALQQTEKEKAKEKALTQAKIQEKTGEVQPKASPEIKEYLPLHMRVKEALPEFFLQPMLTLARWQWLAILLIIVVGIFADKLLSYLLVLLVGLGRRAAKGYYREVPLDMLRPFGLLAMSAIWWMGLNKLGLPDGLLLVLLVAAKFLAVASSVWSAYRLVDLLSASFKERTANKKDDMLVPLLTSSVKMFITVIGIVFVASQMNMDISGLLAGLGLGGLAFALASKNAVENLFGSITVLFDRPFTVGDSVVIGKIEGTVESIGFRSTRIRTFYNSQITLPNSLLITADVDNMGRRRYRRLKCFFNLSYDTSPESIDAFCEGLREIVRQHPHTRKDEFHIYFNGYGESSLDILINIFFMTADWGIELRERHRFLLDALRLAKRLNIEFAYPNRTVHIRQQTTVPIHENHEVLTQLQQANTETAMSIGQQEAISLLQKQEV